MGQQKWPCSSGKAFYKWLVIILFYICVEKNIKESCWICFPFVLYDIYITKGNQNETCLTIWNQHNFYTTTYMYTPFNCIVSNITACTVMPYQLRDTSDLVAN